MISDVRTIRMDCLREAVLVYTSPSVSNNEREKTNVVELAAQFAGFVLGLTWNEETDEWEGPEEDPIEVEEEEEFDPNEEPEPAYSVKAYNDEGQEL